MHIHERQAERKRLNGLMLKSPMKVYAVFRDLGRRVFAEGALSRKHKELTALAVAVSQNCFDLIDHRVEEVLDLGATEAEIAETLDIGLLMGGTLATKSVRHAFAVMGQLKEARPER